MNKQEFKTQYRIARAAVSSIHRSEVSQGLNDDEKKALWNYFWHGVYMAFPKLIYEAVQGSSQRINASPWALDSRGGIRCNIKYLRNSYPRTDVRNTGCAK